MKELIIHVGFSKCGSSSVQSFLTSNPVIHSQETVFRYCCFDNKQQILTPESIKAHENGLTGYTNTIFNKDIDQFAIQLDKINQQYNDNDSIIISNEGLCNPGWLCEERIELLESLNVTIKIFAITRPYVEWLNSGWWQWGCWGDDAAVEKWIRIRALENFVNNLKQWLSLSNVSDYVVIDLSQQPIHSLLNFLSIPENEFDLNKIANRSSSADLLRYLVVNKHKLRRSTHAPGIEFLLNRELNHVGKKAPFVLSKNMVSKLIKENQDTSLELLDLLSWNNERVKDTVIEKYISELPYQEEANNFCFDEFLKEQYESDFIEEIHYWMKKNDHRIME